MVDWSGLPALLWGLFVALTMRSSLSASGPALLVSHAVKPPNTMGLVAHRMLLFMHW